MAGAAASRRARAHRLPSVRQPPLKRPHAARSKPASTPRSWIFSRRSNTSRSRASNHCELPATSVSAAATRRRRCRTPRVTTLSPAEKQCRARPVPRGRRSIFRCHRVEMGVTANSRDHAGAGKVLASALPRGGGGPWLKDDGAASATSDPRCSRRRAARQVAIVNENASSGCATPCSASAIRAGIPRADSGSVMSPLTCFRHDAGEAPSQIEPNECPRRRFEPAMDGRELLGGPRAPGEIRFDGAARLNTAWRELLYKSIVM